MHSYVVGFNVISEGLLMLTILLLLYDITLICNYNLENKLNGVVVVGHELFFRYSNDWIHTENYKCLTYVVGKAVVGLFVICKDLFILFLLNMQIKCQNTFIRCWIKNCCCWCNWIGCSWQGSVHQYNI